MTPRRQLWHAGNEHNTSKGYYGLIINVLRAQPNCPSSREIVVVISKMNAEGRLNLEWTISSLGGWVATRRCMFGTTNAVIFTDHNEIAQLSFNPVSFLHIGFELPSNPEEQHMDQNQVVVHRQGNRLCQGRNVCSIRGYHEGFG